jgi:membrane-bound metal-dependent hydrolase YbcI (DUF457 family)
MDGLPAQAALVALQVVLCRQVEADLARGAGEGLAGSGALCGALSVGMDGDHFLQAGSLSLRAALSLPSRPFAHSLAFLLAAVALAAALAQRGLLPPWAPHLLATALGGHQLRDSLKRGLWVGPFAASPSLPPTPYVLYWCAMALLPLALAPALRALPQQQQQQPPLLPL